MTNNRQFCVSGSKFSQFSTIINLDLVDSIEDIINIVTNRIREDMKKYPQLLIELQKEIKKFHIHDVEFGNILVSNIDCIFYVCAHC
jgi:hypothetical protein